MTSTKYIGMDVHKESISIAVMNSVGKAVMECVIATKASILLQFIHGLRGDLHVTFEAQVSSCAQRSGSSVGHPSRTRNGVRLLALVHIQFSRLIQYRVGDTNLADVVKNRSSFQVPQVRFGHSKVFAKSDGPLGQSS
jgi:hypothetical protein